MIIDGTAAVRQLKVSGLTCKEFAEKLLKSVMKIVKNAERIDLYSTFIWIILSKILREIVELNQILPTYHIKQ